MRDDILKMLRESGGEYLSGERISERLGISRAAVWKHIRALQREGFRIEAATRNGYRMTGMGDVFRPAVIDPLLTTAHLGRSLIMLGSVPSTNQVARRYIAEGCPHGAVITAEEQTAGRGRRGRSWVNAPGKDICMSIVLRPRLEAQHAPRYTFATALGVYRLAEGLGLAPSIKWPNDVLLDGKKFCGVLLEMDGDMDALHSVIVGIGLNVNTAEFPEELGGIATSLTLCAGAPLRRSEVLAALLNVLEPLYEACEQDGGFASMMREYMLRCGTVGQTVYVTGIRETLQGVAEGIDEIGRLLLRTPDGALHSLSAGDVTLRRPAP